MEKEERIVKFYCFLYFRSCSSETIALPGELERMLRAENLEWDKNIPADLKTLALNVIAKNWVNNPILRELPSPEDRDFLIEILPTDLPLELALEKIDYEHFWQRAVEARYEFYNINNSILPFYVITRCIIKFPLFSSSSRKKKNKF